MTNHPLVWQASPVVPAAEGEPVEQDAVAWRRGPALPAGPSRARDFAGSKEPDVPIGRGSYSPPHLPSNCPKRRTKRARPRCRQSSSSRCRKDSDHRCSSTRRECNSCQKEESKCVSPFYLKPLAPIPQSAKCTRTDAAHQQTPCHNQLPERLPFTVASRAVARRPPDTQSGR